jgi:methyl-accepting chemotaxis protein
MGHDGHAVNPARAIFFSLSFPMKFMQLRIGQRLTLGFGLVIAVFLVLAVAAYARIAALNAEIGTIIDGRYATTVWANKLKSQVSDASRGMLALLVMTDEAQIKKELGGIANHMTAHDAALAELTQRVNDDAGKAQLQALKTLHDKFVPAQAGFVDLIGQGNKEDALVKYMFSVRAVQAKYLATVDQFVESQHAVMQAEGDASATQAQRTGWLILGLAVGASLASVAVGFMATRSITKPLARAVTIARRVAAGDLGSHIEVRSNDETGQLMAALRDMNEGLRGIVGDVRQGTVSIATASSQIASGNLELSARTEAQASSLEHTSSAMKALTDTVRVNSESAHQASELAGSACQVATEAGGVVAQVVQTMGNIDASSKKVADIVAVIDGIAFQTNILALNAAVEAARAGEQGRGFAVVASEVRGLAQRSASAAREIKALIGNSVEQVALGSDLVGRAGITMQSVVTSVQRVASLVGEIANASHSQRQGIESVTVRIDEIDAGTQQNAALVEEAAAAAESLKGQAAALESAVKLFKLEPAAV